MVENADGVYVHESDNNSEVVGYFRSALERLRTWKITAGCHGSPAPRYFDFLVDHPHYLTLLVAYSKFWTLSCDVKSANED